MAKKDKTDLDDLDIDNFDLDDLDFSLDPADDSRKPVTKVATGFLEGVKNDLMDGANLKRRLLDILPEGYGRASNLADEVSDTTQELYHTAATEMRPATRDFKRATERLMPKVEGKVPKSWSDRLKDWAKNRSKDDKARDLAADDIRTQEINQNLGRIFDAQLEAQAEMQASSQERQTAEQRLREYRGEKRHTSQISQLDAIREGVNRQVSYQDRVTARYQKKSLELQYRQFFALRDILKINTETSKTEIEHLQGIVKNTSLPEYRKIELTEAGGQMLRDQLLNSAQQGVVDFTSNFMGKFRDNLVGYAKRNAQEISSNISSMSEQLGQVKDMTGEDSGIDRTQFAASTVGGLASDKIISLIAPYVRELAGRNEGVGRVGNALNFNLRSLPLRMNKWAQSETERTGPLGWLERTAKELSPKYYQDSSAGAVPLLDADKPVPFNNLTRRSITEIIPGYLSRIHQELAIMRTGDDSLDRITFNMDRGRFTNLSTARRDILARTFDPDSLTSSRAAIDDFVNQIDQDGELSGPARDELIRQLLRKVAGGTGFDPSELADASSYSGDLPQEERETIGQLFRDRFGVDEDGKFDKTDYLDKIDRKFVDLATAIPDPRQRILGYKQTGHRDLLEDLGLIDRRSSFDYIDYDRVWEIYRRGVVDDDGGTTATPMPGVDGLSRLGGDRVRGGHRDDRVSPSPQDAALAAARAPTYGQDQTTFLKEWFDLYQTHSARLMDGLEARLIPQGDQQIDLLTRILARMDGAFGVYPVDGDGSGPGGPGGPGSGPRGPSGLLGRLKGGLGKMWDATTGFYGGVWRGAGSMVSGAGALGGGMLSRLGSVLGRGRDAIKDIYVKGEVQPRLQAAKLRMGEYRDQVTGKVITSLDDLKDLKGPVVDRMGNVILSLEDLRKGLTDKEGKGILRKGMDFVTGFYGKLFGAAAAPLAFGMKVAQGAARSVFNALRGPVDIYVKGEPMPRLLAVTMKGGGYFNQGDGSVVRRPSDITGTVIDRQGNVVLSVEDMKLGLVDVNGNPIKMSNRLGDWIRGVASMPLRAARWGMGMVGKGIEAVKGLASGARDGLSQAAAANRSVDLLTEIRDILLERLPESNSPFDLNDDGLRDGSWQAIKARREAKRKEKEAEKEGTEKTQNRYGVEGGLLGGLASLLGFGGGKDGEDDDGFVDNATAGATGAAAGGLMSRLWGGVKSGTRAAGRYAARGAGTAARFAATHGGTALRVGGQLALRGAVTAATAATGVVGAPVLAGAALVAGAATVGYLVYRSMKDDGPTPLKNYRLAQYGIDPRNEDDAARILFLEDFLLERIRWQGGVPHFPLREDAWSELFQGLGLSQTTDSIEQFVDWYSRRFKPVFERHVAALHNLDEDIELTEVDEELSTADKQNLFNAVKLPVDGETPYNTTTYPFMPGASLGFPTQQVLLFERIARESILVERGEGNERELEQLYQEANNLAESNRENEEENQRRARQLAQLEANANRNQRGDSQGQPQPGTTDSFNQRVNQNTFGDHTQEFLDQSRQQQTGFTTSGGGRVRHPGAGTGGDINELPISQGDGSWDAHKNLIVAASKMAGVDPGLMATMAAIESNFRAGVRADTSSATGLYQFINGTWKEMLNRYGAKYGISPDAPRTDPRANALMGAEFIKENARRLSNVLDRPLTDTDLYAAHFMGAGGATTLLNSDPATNAATLFPRAASSNRPIFYQDGRPRSVAEVWGELDRRVSTRRDRYAEQARDMAGSLGPAANDPMISNDALAAAQAVSLGNAQQSTDATQSTPEPETPRGMAERLLSQGTEERARAPSSFPGSQPTSSSAPASPVVDRQVRQESVAAARDAEQRDRNERQAAALGSVADILTQSLTTQRSMDDTLKDIREVLRTIPEPRASEPQPPQETATPQRGSRPAETTTNQAPIDMSRRRA